MQHNKIIEKDTKSYCTWSKAEVRNKVVIKHVNEKQLKKGQVHETKHPTTTKSRSLTLKIVFMIHNSRGQQEKISD